MTSGRKRLSSKAQKFISYDRAVAVAQFAFDKATQAKIPAMLIGGVAMGYYGSDRLTRDVDFAAAREFPESAGMPWIGSLSFGGAVYKPEDVEIDWIVRGDEVGAVYRAALEDRAETDIGVDIIQPEWLAIIKLFARRPKDHLDLVFLLRADGLVDRKLMNQHVRDVLGVAAFSAVDELESFALEADLMRARDERHNA